MPTRPQLKREGSKLPGLAAVALFVVLAVIFVRAQFGDPAGIGEGSVTASIGYALFNLGDLAAHETEEFLVAFLVVAVVLDAALDGSIMLAKPEGESPFRVPDVRERVRADGGRDGSSPRSAGGREDGERRGDRRDDRDHDHDPAEDGGGS
jgi:NADH-quinone oxidoreductase subunit J